MKTNIPEGYALIEGRGKENAQKALDAAEKAGVDASEVRTVSAGYLVPEAVAQAYDGVSVTAEEQEAADAERLEAAKEQSTETEGPVEATGTGGDVPAKSASKGDWVSYAETQGYDSSENLSKDQLIERYGSAE